MKSYFLCATIVLLTMLHSVRAMTAEERRQYLDQFLQTVPDVPAFREWQQKTGELPPDFDALPKINSLPDPLRFLNDHSVRTSRDWKARRAEIKQLFEKYVLGTFPPKPKLDNVVAIDETQGNGYVTRNVRLEYGPQRQATMQVSVTIPTGKGPFPVLIGGAGNTLIRREYIACAFPSSVDQLGNLAQLYPGYDFASMGQVAWSVQVVVDYLYTLPQVDKRHIAITGYSRGGKMATIAAALDERISAVIAGSTGVGGVLAWRQGSERNQAESIESTTRMFPIWFVPRLRFFSGREDRLPVDGNLLVAMIAPRACLIEYGLNDEVSNTWGSEQTYHSALNVYKMLGQPDRLGIFRVPGFHGANDQEACLDWLDIQFGRSTRTWNFNLLFPWDFEEWRDHSKETVDLRRFAKHGPNDLLVTASGGTIASTADWEKKADGIRKSVDWMLGDEPPMMPPGAGRGGFFSRGFGGRGVTNAPAGARGFGLRGGARGGANPGQTTPDLVAWVIQRGGQEFGWLEPEKSQTTSRSISFGYNVRGDLYYPTNTPENAKLPTVIWLHSYSYPLGYMWVYHRDLHPILGLVKAGYAVLAFDQTGFGSRMSEAGPFYDRYPHWSQMGRMVEDTRAAIDALQKDSLVDPDRIYLVGYSMGGEVGIYTAALDSRVKGVVSICGFTPMRTDTADRGTGGVARYSHERGLMPRLGFFVGQESRIPYDYGELLATIAPRPVLVVQPQLDRDATPTDVHNAVEQARKVYALYGVAGKLGLDEPWDYNRLSAVTQDRIIEWMSQNLGAKERP
jgi:dienelactone hydrolase